MLRRHANQKIWKTKVSVCEGQMVNTELPFLYICYNRSFGTAFELFEPHTNQLDYYEKVIHHLRDFRYRGVNF